MRGNYNLLFYLRKQSLQRCPHRHLHAFHGRRKACRDVHGENCRTRAVERTCRSCRSSGFYKWLTKKSSLREAKSKKLIQLIQDEFEKSNQIYRSPRIAKKLKEKNHNVSRSYIARIMKRLNIRSKTRKKFKVTTDSSHSYQTAPNLLNRDFTATDVSQKWVSDLTYIRTRIVFVTEAVLIMIYYLTWKNSNKSLNAKLKHIRFVLS